MASPNGAAPAKAKEAGFDLAAYRAAQAEADRETFDFTLGEATVRFPSMEDWPMSSQNLIADGKLEEAIAKVLGEDQMVVFRSFDLTWGELRRLFDRLGEWSGFTTGLSSPPPAAPASTPTSN